MRSLTGLPAAGLVAALGCGSPPAVTSGGAGTKDTVGSGGFVGSVGTTDPTGTAGSATAGAVDVPSDLPPDNPPPLCDRIDVPLVVDPALLASEPSLVEDLAAYFDALTLGSGAEVRVLPNAGTETMLTTSCNLGIGDGADGPVIVWGRYSQPFPTSAPALECWFDALASYGVLDPAPDDGTWIFSGLVLPLLEVPQWPSPAAVGLPMLLSASDDGLSNMYSRPGMASEAYLRLAVDSDRRRAAAFTAGQAADEMELFALTLGDDSRYLELGTAPMAAALEAWLPAALHTCSTHAAPVPPPPPLAGCHRLDVLFVVDGSVSMAEEQEALRGLSGPPVFAEFMDALLAELDGIEDFHVGVVSSQPDDTALHTHSDAPETPPGPATDCGLSPGLRWIVGPTPDLAAQFSCIAATRGSADEYTAWNAAMALQDPANAGFLREDSIVLVVMLTDEDTQEIAAGHTQVDVREALLAAVGGDLRRLVVLAIVGDQGTYEAPKTTCDGVYGTAAPGRRVASIVMSLRERGRLQDLCLGDLAGGFTDLVGDVVHACNSFVPPP